MRKLNAVMAMLAASCGAPAEDPGESEAESEGEPACPDPAPPIDECFAGAAFAECGGEGSPAVRCSKEGGCLWFSDGCPVAGYDLACDPGDPSSPDAWAGCCFFLHQRGEEPWDRERAMLLPVDVDEAVAVTATIVECAGCDETTCGGDDVCNSDRTAVARARLPGTLVVDLDPDGGYLHGFVSQLEVDVDAGTARFCRLHGTDACAPGLKIPEPACATSGALTLSRAPAGAFDLAGLSGVLDAAFEDGLAIHAEFLVREDCQPPITRGEGSDGVPAGLERCGDGVVHRFDAITCAANDPAPVCESTSAECAVDADCDAQGGGVCFGYWAGCACRYDCAADDECLPGQACLCNARFGDYAFVDGRSECLPAGCRTDADCGGYLCVVSLDSCGLTEGLYCHSEADECRRDDDCAAGRCYYDGAGSRWTCGEWAACE